MMTEWKIKYGDKEIELTAKDVADSIGRAIGLMFCDLEDPDGKTRRDVQMRIVREIDIQTLEVTKTNFLALEEEERKRHAHMTLVKKNPVGHTLKGKPGDIVEMAPGDKEKP